VCERGSREAVICETGTVVLERRYCVEETPCFRAALVW